MGKPSLKLGAGTQGKRAGAAAMADAVEAGQVERIAARKAVKEIPQWQQGRRVVTAWLLDEQFVRLNNVHVKRRMSIRALIEEAVNDLLLKHGELPVPLDSPSRKTLHQED